MLPFGPYRPAYIADNPSHQAHNTTSGSNNSSSQSSSPSHPSAQCPNPHTTSNTGIYAGTAQNRQFLSDTQRAFDHARQRQIDDAVIDLRSRGTIGNPYQMPRNAEEAWQERQLALQMLEQDEAMERSYQAAIKEQQRAVEESKKKATARKAEQAATKALEPAAPNPVEEKKPELKEKQVDDLTTQLEKTSLSGKKEDKTDQKSKDAETKSSKTDWVKNKFKGLKDSAKEKAKEVKFATDMGAVAGANQLKKEMHPDKITSNLSDNLADAFADGIVKGEVDPSKIANEALEASLKQAGKNIAHETAKAFAQGLGYDSIPGISEFEKVGEAIEIVTNAKGVGDACYQLVEKLGVDTAIEAASLAAATTTVAAASAGATAATALVFPPAAPAVGYACATVAPVATKVTQKVYSTTAKAAKTYVVDSFKGWMWPKEANAGSSAIQPTTTILCSASSYGYIQAALQQQASSVGQVSRTTAQWQQTFSQAQTRFNPGELGRNMLQSYPDASIGALFIRQAKA